MSVANDRRYTRGQRCPICGGADSDARGAGKRCWGFLSDDGDWAHCSREELAGTLEKSPSDTYGHRLTGSCACGHTHAKPIEERAPRVVDIGHVVAEYNYHDESGVLLYQVRRYGPIKTFRQFRPDGSGGWVPGLDPKDKAGKPTGVKTRRILYRLDRMLEADPETIIWIVEGEKDVQAMELLGFVATCNPMGAGKWHMVTDCAKKALKGRHIVVIADDDSGAKNPADRTKGKDHALDVKKRLEGIAASVRVIEKPVRGHDAASWIEQGGTAEEFLAAIPPLVPPDPSDFERERGKPIDSQANIKLALRKLGVTVRYDQFGDREIVAGLPGFGPELDDAAYNQLRMTIDATFDFRIGKEFFYDVIANLAREQRFHPVREYLDALHWDHVARIETWLTIYAGAEDTAYTRAVGRIVLVAAVRRVRQPGCKYDEMLILESEQGTNKSTALAILAVHPDWFTDDLPLSADTKRQMESTSGRWIVEAGELKGMSKGDVHQLKGYLSRGTDVARMAYGRKKTTMPRQFVIIGTTNETADYLKDGTGNRRFWPVRIQRFDLERLRSDRDQLWAEAVHLEAAGESIRLDPSLYGAAAEEQEERRAEDAMEILIGQAYGELTGKILITEAWKILGIEGRTLTPDETTRFGVAMRKLRWKRAQRRHDGARPYFYVKGDADERELELIVDGKGPAACVVPAETQ